MSKMKISDFSISELQKEIFRKIGQKDFEKYNKLKKTKGYKVLKTIDTELPCDFDNGGPWHLYNFTIDNGSEPVEYLIHATRDNHSIEDIIEIVKENYIQGCGGEDYMDQDGEQIYNISYEEIGRYGLTYIKLDN